MEKPPNNVPKTLPNGSENPPEGTVKQKRTQKQTEQISQVHISQADPEEEINPRRKQSEKKQKIPKKAASAPERPQKTVPRAREESQQDAQQKAPCGNGGCHQPISRRSQLPPLRDS